MLYLAFADAYDFYSAGVAKKAVRHTGRTGSVFIYLYALFDGKQEHILSILWACAAIACFLPLLFGEFQGHEYVSHRPCDPLPEHAHLYAAVLRPGSGAGDPCSARTGRPVLPESIVCLSLLSMELSPASTCAVGRSFNGGDRTLPMWVTVLLFAIQSAILSVDFGMETPDPWLENRKRFVAPPPQISRPAGNAADGGLCRHLWPPVLWIWSAVLLMECGILLYWARRE